MKKTTLIILSTLVVGGVIYAFGPRPNSISTKEYKFDLPDASQELEDLINQSELSTPGLKPDNQARIIWADTSKKEMTENAFLYLHGFSASQEEGDPVIQDIAKHFGGNLYLNRLISHGIDLGDETMSDFTAEKAIESVEKALAITQKLGKKVHIVGTSFGGALTLYLASKHPEISTITLYSPCIEIADPSAKLLDKPWGHQIAKLVKGENFNDITKVNEIQPKYWSMHYRLEAVVQLQNFLSTFMVPATFEEIEIPVFVGYYYKDEENQDKVVSVPAILKMYDALGSKNKEKMAFPNTGNHVMASYVHSKDYQTVEKESIVFLSKYIK
jgi:esterase/lipase